MERALGKTGFTIMEILVVVAIMAVLMLLALPSVNSTLEGSKLQTSGFLISDVLQQARQYAAARNTPVEVRIYRIPIDGLELWNGFQIRAMNPMKFDEQNGSLFEPLSRLIRLGDSMALNPAFSPILDEGGVSGTDMLPIYGACAYRGLRFNPDGSLQHIYEADENYLTIVHSRSLANGATDLPPNFLAVQINPYTGASTTYQP